MAHSCDPKSTFQECELAILRTVVDEASERQSSAVANSPEVKKMISIVEDFLRRKRLVCYGGTAINALLPTEDQFYNKETEIADYDFYSPNPVADAKELADIYVKEGFDEVEAKSGQHHGTYKVFVNFIGMADITYMEKGIYERVKEEAVSVGGILYAPANFLRMGMYLELSRPSGDVSRWEKVLKRLGLLNKSYPLRGPKCYNKDFQREMTSVDKKEEEKIYTILRDTFINQGVIFFGGYAISKYRHYMSKKIKDRFQKIPDFDVLSEEPELVATIVKERLEQEGIDDVKIVKKKSIGEIVASHYQIIVNGNDTVAFIYEPLACHSYNIINEKGRKVNIATIDTILSFYLAFLFAKVSKTKNDKIENVYDEERLLCIAEYLFKVQEKNKLAQRGVLKRFSLDCYGHQETIEEMRAEKTKKFQELKNKKDSKEYEEWFLKYNPNDTTKKQKGKKSKTKKTKKSKRKNKTKKWFYD